MIVPLKIFNIMLFIFVSSVFTQLSASNLSSEEELEQNVISKNRWPNIPEDIRLKKLTLGYLALSNTTSILSKGITTFSKGKYSHIAMILCDPNDLNNKESWYCFESSPYPGKPAHDIKSSYVHIIEWEKSLFTQNITNAALRAFNFSEKNPSSDEVKDAINVYLDRLYKNNYSEIFLLFLNRSNNSEDARSLFCSELVAITS